MKYRFFISHAQVDAASTAKAMYGMLARLGVHCWYDMQQKALTLIGMKNVSGCINTLVLSTRNFNCY